MNTCGVNNCIKQTYGKGFCKQHYERNRLFGSPTYYIIHNKTYTSTTSTYVSWKSMKTRCNNPNASNYYKYGGKGIKICDSWNSFVNFLNDMGERPINTSLDRVDSSGNYEPSNCRWATYKVQARDSGRRKTII